MDIKVKYQARIDGMFSVIAEEDMAGFKKGQIIDIVKEASGSTYDISKKHAKETKIYYPEHGQISLFELLDKLPPVKRYIGIKQIEFKKRKSISNIDCNIKTYYRYRLELSDGGLITISKHIYDMFKHLKTEEFKFR